GHPQEAYMSLVVLAIWTLTVYSWDGIRPLLRGVAVLAVLTALGSGLAAVQLLPTLSLAALGIRGGGIAYADAVAVSLPLKLLPRVLLPGYWTDLPSTEYLGHVGAIPLALAFVALGCARSRFVLPCALAVGVALFLAIGDANPLYPLLFDYLPGVSAFRVPARWLFVSTFGLSALAALGLDAAGRGELGALLAQLGARRRALARAIATLGLGLAVAGWQLTLADPQPRRLEAAWGGSGLLVALLAFGSSRPMRGARTRAMVVLRGPAARWMVVALATLELWLATPALAAQEPTPAAVYSGPRPSTAYLQARSGGGRVLSIAQEAYEPREAPEIRARYAGLPERAVYNFLVAAKWNEILMPNIPTQYGLDSVDGYDGGVLPLREFVTLSGVLVPPDRVRSDGVLLSRLSSLPADRYLDLLNVRYVVDSRLRDTTVGGVSFDRSIVASLAPGQQLELGRLPGYPVDGVALLSAVEGPRAPAVG